MSSDDGIKVYRNLEEEFNQLDLRRPMREERYFAAEEQAEKTAVKLIVPMVLFIFPAVFIITAGPAVVEIAKMMATY